MLLQEKQGAVAGVTELRSALERYFRHRSGASADDLVQETLLVLLGAEERFEGRSSLRTYGFAVARRLLHRERARHAREAARLLTDDVDEIVDVSHDVDPASHEAEDRLAASVARLARNDRDVLGLYYVDGLSGPEVADCLHLPEATVRSRLRRAVQRLRAELSENTFV